VEVLKPEKKKMFQGAFTVSNVVMYSALQKQSIGTYITNGLLNFFGEDLRVSRTLLA